VNNWSENGTRRGLLLSNYCVFPVSDKIGAIQDQTGYAAAVDLEDHGQVLTYFLSWRHLPIWRSSVGKKLFVGNLSFSTTESAINELFAQHGTVDSCRLITDRETGRGKGFAFVEMSTSEEAQGAITTLDGREFDGRALKVNEARPQTESRGFGGGGSRSSYGGGERRTY